MNKRMWSRQVILKFSLLQIPGIVIFVLILLLIRHWVSIPAWAVWACIGLWILMDFALFPFVWHAYEIKVKHPIIGSTGIAVDRLNPSGHIRADGALWNAQVIRDSPPVEEQESVTVIGMDGLTLIVKPTRDEESRSQTR